MEWWNDGRIEWWNDGTIEDGMMEWLNDGTMEWWNDGISEWLDDGMLELWNDGIMEQIFFNFFDFSKIFDVFRDLVYLRFAEIQSFDSQSWALIATKKIFL